MQDLATIRERNRVATKRATFDRAYHIAQGDAWVKIGFETMLDTPWERADEEYRRAGLTDDEIAARY